MQAIIDRFEGDNAKLEIEGRITEVKRSEVPADCREGDVLQWKDNKWAADREATDVRKKEIESLISQLWKD